MSVTFIKSNVYMSYLYTVRVMKYVLGISSLLFYDGTVFLIGALYLAIHKAGLVVYRHRV